MTFPDEYRYYESVEAVECHGKFVNFCASLSQTQGRPGDALWRVVPAAIQVVLIKMGFLYPIHDEGWCNEIRLPPSCKLIYSEPHFLTMPAYGFEGCRMAERDIIYRCQYQCQVYEKR